MTDLLLANLKEKILPIALKYELEKVYLFGSRARGDWGESSDYDFFIKRGKLRGMFQLSGLFRELKKVLNCEVDIVLDPEGVGKISEYMQEEIDRDGMLIYG